MFLSLQVVPIDEKGLSSRFFNIFVLSPGLEGLRFRVLKQSDEFRRGLLLNLLILTVYVPLEYLVHRKVGFNKTVSKCLSWSVSIKNSMKYKCCPTTRVRTLTIELKRTTPFLRTIKLSQQVLFCVTVSENVNVKTVVGVII